MQVTLPGFLDYNGPALENLSRASLPPDFDTMTPGGQQKAKALHQSQTLHNLYLALSRQVNPVAFQAIQGPDTLRHQVSVVPGLTALIDYEPCLSNLLREIENESVPCPLQFSAAEVEQQQRDEELWAQGVEPMTEFIRDNGAFKHWDGRIRRDS